MSVFKSMTGHDRAVITGCCTSPSLSQPPNKCMARKVTKQTCSRLDVDPLCMYMVLHVTAKHALRGTDHRPLAWGRRSGHKCWHRWPG